MPKMVVTHSVVDIERWLGGKAERVEIIRKYATNVTDYVAGPTGATKLPSRPISTTWLACRHSWPRLRPRM